MSDGKAAEVDEIRVLNAQMHAEEKRGAAGLGFYRELLDQTLRFRRASGAVVTRDEYLIDLANPANTAMRSSPWAQSTARSTRTRRSPRCCCA